MVPGGVYTGQLNHVSEEAEDSNLWDRRGSFEMPTLRDGGQVDGVEVAKSQSPTRSTAETDIHGGRAPTHPGGCRPICCRLAQPNVSNFVPEVLRCSWARQRGTPAHSHSLPPAMTIVAFWRTVSGSMLRRVQTQRLNPSEPRQNAWTRTLEPLPTPASAGEIHPKESGRGQHERCHVWQSPSRTTEEG